MIKNIIENINRLLISANYETLVFDIKAKFCFDLLVKKGNSILLIKIFPNIDNLNKNIITGIKTLSSLLKSKPVLIGIKNRYQNLEDNTIHIREGLPFINLNTFENILKNRSYPYIFAKRGGSVIFLDGTLMKTEREQKNISRKDIAIELGITKRTISAYENEKIRPSEKIAFKILKLLENEDIFKKIDILEWKFKFSIPQKKILNNEELSPFESHLQEIIDDIGVGSFWYKKGQVPFNLSIYSKQDKIEGVNNFFPLFSGVSEEKSKLNELNIKLLMSFSKLLKKHALFIVNNDLKIPHDLENVLPIVKIKSIEEIDTEADFIEFIRKKGE